MADTLKQIPSAEALQGPVPSVPLRGYVVEEDNERLWVQDHEGTWAVKRADIVATQDWSGSDPRFKGKPTCVFIRDGADILEVRPYRVKLARLPITLGATTSEPTREGEAMMRTMEQRMYRHLGFMEERRTGPLFPPIVIGTTVCCYGNPHGMGIICEGDDCGPIEAL